MQELLKYVAFEIDARGHAVWLTFLLNLSFMDV